MKHNINVISTKAVGRMEKSVSRRSFDSALQATLKMTGKAVIPAAMAVLCLLTACDAGFLNINRNPNEVYDEQMNAKNYRTGTMLTKLQSYVVPVEEHLYQFCESLSAGPFAGYIGATNTWENKFETFNPDAHWRKAPFADVITEAYVPYRELAAAADDEVTRAFASVLKVSIMSRVTDYYGPIPYSRLENNDKIYVAYDSQEQVYRKMMEELSEASAAFGNNLSLGAESWASYDKVYYGNISQWYRYTNSLKLRLAMRMCYAAPDFSRQMAEEAIAAGIIEANADNAMFHPVDNRMDLIYNSWNDHRVGADIISYMNGYKDPRREKMFTRPVRDEKYLGIRIGIAPWNKEWLCAYHSNILIDANTPYLWMNAAETAFLRAEYELRWGSVEAARQWYETGITLSFEEKGVDGAADYMKDNESKQENYISPLSGEYNCSALSDATIAWKSGDTRQDMEKNLEKIIVQKWIAIFPLGGEAWAEHRRTGYPKLFPIVCDLSGGTVNTATGPRRLVYPVEEYDLNRANLDEAVGILDKENSDAGFKGDLYGTKVWWDCR